MDIVCDKCNIEFALDSNDIKLKNIDDIEITYFECKHCEYKYIINCIDGYIKKEQRRYNKLKTKDKRIKCLNNMKTHSDILKLKVKDKL